MRAPKLATVTMCLSLATLAGCNRGKTAPAPIQPGASPAAPAASGPAPQRFGDKLKPGKAVSLAEVLASPDRFASQTVTVEAQVRKACTRKGCWMELADSTKEGTPGCRVTFKDYGFFVPLDSAGSTARVQGKVEVDTLSASAVRHYEEEGAAFAKAPDGTAREIRIVASGVELTRPAKLQ